MHFPASLFYKEPGIQTQQDGHFENISLPSFPSAGFLMKLLLLTQHLISDLLALYVVRRDIWTG